MKIPIMKIPISVSNIFHLYDFFSCSFVSCFAKQFNFLDCNNHTISSFFPKDLLPFIHLEMKKKIIIKSKFKSPFFSSSRFLAASSRCFLIMANRARSARASSVLPKNKIYQTKYIIY